MGYGAMRLAGRNILGPPPDVEAAADVLRRAIDLGVNLIDTADAYGPGHNEELIAQVLSPYPEGLVIATKGGLVRSPDGAWTANGRPDHLRRACEDSLRRLRLETIDLYQLHRPDPEVPLEESVGLLRDLQDEGKVRLIGVSNVDLRQLTLASDVADIASVQNPYNLHDREHEDVLRACEADGTAFIPYYPLKGFGYDKGTPALAEVGQAHGASPAAAALAWLLARSPVMVPIPGTSSTRHLEQNVAAAAIQLTEAERERLDAFRPALSDKLGALKGPLSEAGRERVRAAAGPLRRLWQRLRFWD